MTPEIHAYGGLILTQVSPPETPHFPFLGEAVHRRAQNLFLGPPPLLKVTVVAADILNVPNATEVSTLKWFMLRECHPNKNGEEITSNRSDVSECQPGTPGPAHVPSCVEPETWS